MAAMAVTALATAMDTAMARGPLMPMPMPTTAMVDMAMAMAVTALATAMATATARGLLMPMPMPTTAMVDMAATAMAVTALDTAMDTATARGPLRPSPTTAMADTDTESKKSKSISCNNTKNPTPNHLKLTYLNGQENYGCVSFKQRQRV